MRVQIPGFNLRLTAESGQCFRFKQAGPGDYHLTAFGRALEIKDLGEGTFDFSCGEDEFHALWQNYFDLGRDYDALHALPVMEGSYLHHAMNHARGVRILRQEPFETLIAFIISQRKSIPAIKSCVEALCNRFGQEIVPGTFAFPSPQALAEADEASLLACGLGYRMPYVKNTARMVHEGAVNLETLSGAGDETLSAALQGLPGVGKKVAACVMLFAYHRMDAFPVDLWIQKVLSEHYPQGFPFDDYPGVCGILQQYLFCYARHQAKSRA